MDSERLIRFIERNESGESDTIQERLRAPWAAEEKGWLLAIELGRLKHVHGVVTEAA